MVKIKDLTEEQLEQQIAKYEKILGKLHREREKRFPGRSYDKTDISSYQFSIDDTEARKIDMKQAQKDLSKEPVEEEVRVTQLLKLSKKELAELQDHKDSIKEKK